jgi:hypothetical protein
LSVHLQKSTIDKYKVQYEKIKAGARQRREAKALAESGPTPAAAVENKLADGRQKAAGT